MWMDSALKRIFPRFKGVALNTDSDESICNNKVSQE
jgi:hypothetical protein